MIGHVLLVSVLAVACWVGYRDRLARQSWYAQRDRIERLIVDLQPTDPTEIRPEDWNEAIMSLQAAIWNGCYAPATVSADELSGLEPRVRKVCNRAEIDYQTLVDIFNEIGTTSEASRKYATAALPWFLGVLEVRSRGQFERQP